MCGICGHTSDPRGAAVRAMNAAQVHRGPDDSGVHIDAGTGVAIGATRLSIIDVEGGHQPLANEDGTIVAVLNGEIYNHPVLQRQLRGRGHQLRTTCDTEVLVHLYEDYGDDLVHALDGMFAFAIWDSVRRRLLLGRDRFGEKPLYFSDADGLVFASELTALLAGGVNPEPDPGALDAYFVLGYVPGPATALSSVRQLLPGHLLTFEDGRVATRAYWRPPAFPGSAGAGDDDVAEVEQLLVESVRSRMIADVPLGVFLSGGTDSTLVASLAAEHSSAPVRTFTVGYDVGAVSETAPAREAAEAMGTYHHELILRSGEVETLARDVFGRLDQPVADQALLASYAVSRFAREHVKVVVGGEGADELFGGYPRYRWLALSDRIGRGLPAPAARAAALGVRGLGLRGRLQRLEHVLDDVPLARRQLDWVSDDRSALRAQLYGPQLAPSFQASALGGLGASGRHEDAARALMLHDQTSWLPDDVLMKADRASMLASLEVRTPFLSPALADFAAVVPTARHLRGGGKALLRELLDRRYPGTRRRSKVAFRVPAGDWLRGPLQGVVREQLASSRLYADGYFDRREVGRMLDAHVAGTVERTSVLWSLMVLAFWIDRIGSATAA